MDILAVGKCTACLLIEEGEVDGKVKRRYLGTAFFVSDHHLLTAGHNVVGVNGPVTRICITTPGLERVQPWQRNQEASTIECRLLGTIYRRNGLYTNDIAILDSCAYKAPHYLPLSSLIPPPNSIVDVIGYPNEIRHEWIKIQDGLRDPTEGQKEAIRLLPAGRLIVTRGAADTADTTIPYHISTCPGMGGSCVLFKGVVVGTCLWFEYSCIGVHIGQFDKHIQNFLVHRERNISVPPRTWFVG